jgi:tetratricopeptide (TPR) repeat protein
MTPAEQIAEARAALQHNDPRRAEQLCRHLLRDRPGHAEALLLLGRALLAQQRAGDAVEPLAEAVRLAPASTEARLTLAQALSACGRGGEALAQTQQAAALAPQNADVQMALGLALAGEGRSAEALAAFAAAARLRPGDAQAQHNLGVALAQAGRQEEAARAFQEALRLRPAYAEACYSLANVLRDLGRREEALALFRRAVELRPLYGDALNNLGLTLNEAGRHGEALIVLRQSVRLRPQASESFNNLCLALEGLGRFAEAEAVYQEALRLDPAAVDAHTNLGSTLKEQGRYEEAQASYQMALWLRPDHPSARYNRSLAWLQAGEWDRGWPEYEWRWRRGGSRERHTERPRWDGSPSEGKTVLLWAEQGLGDTLQFVRYAAMVKAKGARVVLECPGALAPLLRTCEGVDEVVAEGEALPPFDAQVPLLSLPGLFGVTVEDVQVAGPYLRAETERVEKWRARLAELGDGLKVGVVWQGNPRFQWDRWRSFSLAELAPLAAVPGVRLVSLQKGPGAEQVKALRGRFEVAELEGLDEGEGAFLDTAAALTLLDVLVTADTAAAHLAGALGVPCWLALAAVSDWRWLRGREDTPWYPQTRLFRQERLGDWAAVFGRMAAELSGRAARHGAGQRCD